MTLVSSHVGKDGPTASTALKNNPLDGEVKGGWSEIM